MSKKFSFWISVITKNGIKSGAVLKKMEGKLSDHFLGQAINGVMIALVSLGWNKVARSFLKLIIADFKTVVLSSFGGSGHHCAAATVLISGRSAKGVDWRFIYHLLSIICLLLKLTRFVKKPSFERYQSQSSRMYWFNIRFSRFTSKCTLANIVWRVPRSKSCSCGPRRR